MDNGNLIRKYNGHTRSVEGVAFNPNGSFFAPSAQDNSIILWSVDNSNPLKILTGHTARIDSVDFNSSGSRLVSGSYGWNYPYLGAIPN